MSSPVLPDVGSDPRRLVRLDAVHNFRDMGGYPTVDGRTTRWRTLFRADGLYRLTTADLDRLRELALRTVVDLRTNDELTERGTFPHHEHPVDFHHVSVIDHTWTPDDSLHDADAADFLESAYRTMLDRTPDRFADAFQRLCAPGAMPAVFHCAAGKDRTGVLAMLLLGGLGVPEQYIAADYALTESGMQRMREWSLREFPELHERITATPAVFSAAVPEAMMRVVRHITGEFGSIRQYVREIGVPDDAVDRLADAFLE